MISVIVTIYNSEKFLKRLFKSFDEQIDKNYELILINDGSTDNSEKICLEYIRNKNIKYIKKKNEGVSEARNCGIIHAKGEYICFIDSDDILSNKYILDFNNSIKQQPDCVCCKYIPIKQKNLNKKRTSSTTSKIKITNPNDLIFSNYGGYIWNKLLKKEIITKKNLKFNKDIMMCEDMLFLHEYMKNCKKIILLDSINYYYIVSKKSLSKNKENMGWYTNFIVYEKMIKELNLYSEREKQKLIYEYIIHLYEGKYRAKLAKLNKEFKTIDNKIVNLEKEGKKHFINKKYRIKLLIYKKLYKIIFTLRKR
jgi:glycosyltransferase involved in cell wall biosynthesis